MTNGEGVSGGEGVAAEITGKVVDGLMDEVCAILERIPAYKEANRAAKAAANRSDRAPTAIFQVGDTFYKLHHGDYGSSENSFSWVTVSTFASREAAEVPVEESKPIEFMDLSNDKAISAFGDIDSEQPKIVYEDPEGRNETDPEALRKTLLLLDRLRALRA